MTSGATKRAGISEEDAFSLLQRYSPTTILTFLQEVSQVASVRIDWDALVKGSATGITNAREYQMLWRHLAYHHTLLDKIEDGAEPLDDESDLELEIDAVPTASSEDISEAVACVKVLASHGLSQGIGQTSLEAPSVVKGFKEKMLCVPPDKQQKSQANHGANIKVPYFQKHLLSGTSTQGSEPTGSSYPPKKKRKLWTIEEDMALIAAEQKFGGGNWVDILKNGNFNFDRNSSQLSQRWSTLKRKYGSNLHASYGIKSPSSTRSEQRLAIQKTISLALDKRKYGRKGSVQSISEASTSVLSVAISEPLPVSSQPLNQLKQHSPLTTSQAVTLNTLNKSGIQKSMEDVVLSAGGRRAQPSDAAAFIKATQSKNAVHIRASGGAQPSNSNIKTLAVPNTADKSVQASPVSSPSGTGHGGQKVQRSSTDAKDPPSTPSTTQETVETKVGNNISATDANELMAEEVKSAGQIDLHGSTGS